MTELLIGCLVCWALMRLTHWKAWHDGYHRGYEAAEADRRQSKRPAEGCESPEVGEPA